MLKIAGNVARTVIFGAMCLAWSVDNAEAQQLMSTNELLATIPGSQMSGISNSDWKTRWVQAYSAAQSDNSGLLSGI